MLLRVRNLRTNFYTYAGVVKALDGVSFDMWEGDTLGLVGETGCGKSVTALSVLRLIAQPPGKIEEGEALFDVPADVLRDIEQEEAAVRAALPAVFGESSDARPEDLGVKRLRTLSEAVRTRKDVTPKARDALLSALGTLLKAKEPYDLLGKSDEEMRKIRGNKIAMIFQEPMQALNPVFPIGDQIAENILLHQRDSVVRALVDKMELERERDAIAKELRAVDPIGATSDRPLPPTGSRPRGLVLAVAAWFAVSTAAVALFLAAALLPAHFRFVTASVHGFPVVLAAVSVVVAGALWDLKPWARGVSPPLAALQGLTFLFLILFPYPWEVRLFVLGGALVDLGVLWYVLGAEAKASVVGQRWGWEAALVAAEGDPGELSEVRDLLAGSRLPETTREGLVARLEAFLPRVQRLLERDESVTGHFHPLFPRRPQLSLYRRMRRPSAAEVARLLRDALASPPGAAPGRFPVEGIPWVVEEPARIRIAVPRGMGPGIFVGAIERALDEIGLARLHAVAAVELAPTAKEEAAVEDGGAVIVRVAPSRHSFLVRFLRRVPVVRRLVERPIYEEAVRRAVGVLGRVKISDPSRIARQYPYELSGGMQQRSLIAIAMSCNPRLLIADEPTTALDVTIQAQILDLIRAMKKEFGSSVLIITHDLGIIAEMCNRVCVMYAGTIAEDTTVRAVFKAPLHPYTQGLMKSVPSHTVRKRTLEIIRGSVPNLIFPPPGCRFHPRCPAVMPTCGWSPEEVGQQLRGLFRELAAESPLPFDIGSLGWETSDAAALRILLPAGVAADVVADAVRRARERAQGRPAIGAIVSVEASPAGEPDAQPVVVVRTLSPVKPPAFTPEPGHAVACLLYESPSSMAVAGGVRRG